MNNDFSLLHVFSINFTYPDCKKSLSNFLWSFFHTWIRVPIKTIFCCGGDEHKLWWECWTPFTLMYIDWSHRLPVRATFFPPENIDHWYTTTTYYWIKIYCWIRLHAWNCADRWIHFWTWNKWYNQLWVDCLVQMHFSNTFVEFCAKYKIYANPSLMQFCFKVILNNDQGHIVSLPSDIHAKRIAFYRNDYKYFMLGLVQIYHKRLRVFI